MKKKGGGLKHVCFYYVYEKISRALDCGALRCKRKLRAGVQKKSSLIKKKEEREKKRKHLHTRGITKKKERIAALRGGGQPH